MKLCNKNKCPKDKAIIQFIFESEFQQMKAKALKVLVEETHI